MLLAALSNPGARRALSAVARTAARPKILLPFACFSAYVGAVVYLAARLGAWNGDLTADTIGWFVATGVVLFFGSVQAAKEKAFFRRTARRVLAVGALLEIYINLVVFPLPVELLLQPVVAGLVLLSTVAESSGGRSVRQAIDGILGALGLGLFAYVTVRLATGVEPLGIDLGLSFALPVWLSLSALPAVYGIGLYAAYESAFVRMSSAARNKRVLRRAKLHLIAYLNVRARKVAMFDHRWQAKLLAAGSRDEAREVLRTYLRGLREAPT